MYFSLSTVSGSPRCDTITALPFAQHVAAQQDGELLFNRFSRGLHVAHRQPRGWDGLPRGGNAGPSCSSRCSRPTVLGHAIAAVWIMVFLVHIISCGLFFCVTIPMGRSQTIEILPEKSIFSSQPQPQQPRLDALPKLIPRIIHQTYKSRTIPEKARPVVQSWAVANPTWEYRFYDDAACLDFVERYFPEYLEAYQSLPKDVERSDFFRYMVVLRMGGVYADIDVECRQPLDTLVRPSDTMLVGWESEVATDVEAFKRHFVRKRQVLQWFFAASPGHPALRAICDHIAENAWKVFSNNTNRDTLERTGPGIWTDTILKHAATHPVSQHDDPWRIRIMPRVAFGVHPSGIDNLTPDAKEIVVLHHFLGSWKVRGGWQKQNHLWKLLTRRMATLFPWLSTPKPDAPEEPIKNNGVPHFPVSTAFEPPFTMLVDLVGHGDTQAGRDVSALLTAWGTYQPALAPVRKPSVVTTLVGSLRARKRSASLVDVGAGQGFFSLAAAAKNHKAVAFERSPASVAALEASARYNGFQGLVQLHQVPLGARDEPTCVRRRGLQGVDDAHDINVRRGYGGLDVHAHPLEDCEEVAQRRTLAGVLGNDTSVGAVRISASGWEGWVVEGALPYLRRVHKPEVIMLELYPHLMRRVNYTDPTRLLRQLYELGYSTMAHAGYVCDERWANITRNLRVRGSFSADAQEALKQPTWCKLQAADFPLLVAHAHEEVPENVLLLYRPPTPAAALAADVQQPQPPPLQQQQEAAAAGADAAVANTSAAAGAAAAVAPPRQQRVPLGDAQQQALQQEGRGQQHGAAGGDGGNVAEEAVALSPAAAVAGLTAVPSPAAVPADGNGTWPAQR